MIHSICECGKGHRNRTGNRLCRRCRVKAGELNRPNRKQVGKGRTYRSKTTTTVAPKKQSKKGKRNENR